MLADRLGAGPALLTTVVVPYAPAGWIGLSLLFVVAGVVVPRVAVPAVVEPVGVTTG